MYSESSLPLYKSPYVSFVLSSLALVLLLVAVTSDSWIVTGDNSQGLFYEENDSNHVVILTCSSSMGETQCQTFISAKISSVIAILISSIGSAGLGFKLYHSNYRQDIAQYARDELSLDSIITTSFILTVLFECLAVIFYGAFASSYYMGETDDVNVEDDASSQKSYYNYALYLWIFAIILHSFLIVTAEGKGLIKCLLCRKEPSRDDDLIKY